LGGDFRLALLNRSLLDLRAACIAKRAREQAADIVEFAGIIKRRLNLRGVGRDLVHVCRQCEFAGYEWA
jgi:hypothetical protein